MEKRWGKMHPIDEGPDSYVTVMAGRWIRNSNGTLYFKIDMSRNGRSINCRNVDSAEDMRLLIASSYEIDAKVISLEMTYWIEDLVAERNGTPSSPVEIVTDRDYRQFTSLCRSDSSVNIFVTFRRLVDDRLEIMGPKNSDTSSHEPVKDCLRIPQKLEEDAVENDEGLEEVEWLTGEDEEDDDDGDDDDDRDGEDDRENGDEEDNGGEYDEEDYEYDRWHEFVRNDCEWSSQELDWGSNNSQGSKSVKSNEIPNCQGDTRRKDNIDSTGRNEKIDSRVTKAEIDYTGRKKKIDSTGRNQNKDKGRLICYNGDDDFVDPPSVRVRSDYGSSSGLKGRQIAYGGDDDFVDPPRVRRDNGGSALKKGMHVTEIYGYADLEPMFRDTETNKYKIHEIDLSGEDDDIYIGRVFNDKEEFKLVMAIYAIKRVFRFVFSRHTCNSVVASCITKRCDWRVYAVRIGDLDEYEVRKAHLTHRCDVDSRGRFSKHATSRVVAALLRSKYETIYGGPRARELPEMMLKEYNIDVSYWKCWKAKELALGLARGTDESSFRLLPLYLYVVKLANPGSITHLVTEVDGKGNPRFKYTFIAFGASIKGWKHLRKMVVIDGTHLNGKYKGCLMTASGQDANFQIFPIAFAVVDSETDESWTWFMEKLSAIVEDSTDLTIISDRHQSIYCGKNIVYPKAHHGACLIHIERNVQTKYGKAMKAMVRRAGEAYRVGQFKRFYEVIKKKNFRTWEFLETIGVEHWTRAYFKGDRYNLMSSNIAESLNKALLPARDCPIIGMLEFIRKRLSSWLESRREIIGKMGGEIPEAVRKELQIRLEDSTGLSTVKCSEWDFEVSSGSASTFQFRVDLLRKTCSCREFDLVKIPCRHAIAAARYHGVEYKVLVDDLYKKAQWALTVAGVILPVPDPDDIVIPAEIRDREVFPPKTRRPPGRPPKKRILSTGEFKVGRKKCKPNKCGRCGKGGHNRVTCKAALD